MSKYALKGTLQGAARIAIVAWFVGMIVLGAGLLARHALALPAPLPSADLGASLATLRSPRDVGRWLAVHVLYSECRCSLRVVSHLVDSPRSPDWSEVVLWVGSGEPDPRLEARGFEVVRLSQADLARLHIESAPLLVALDPANQVRYAGGYTSRKQGPDLDVQRILDAARGTTAVPGLPVFGCAVSERLRRELSSLPTP